MVALIPHSKTQWVLACGAQRDHVLDGSLDTPLEDPVGVGLWAQRDHILDGSLDTPLEDPVGVGLWGSKGPYIRW